MIFESLMSVGWFLMAELAHKWVSVSHSVALWSSIIHLLIEFLLFLLGHGRLLGLHVHRLVVYVVNINLEISFLFYFYLPKTLSASYMISLSIEFYYSCAVSYVKSIKFPFIGCVKPTSYTADRKFMFIYKVDTTSKKIIIDYYIKIYYKHLL